MQQADINDAYAKPRKFQFDGSWVGVGRRQLSECRKCLTDPHHQLVDG